MSESKLKCIYLDMDGVIVDFVGAALALYGVSSSAQTKITSWDGIPVLLTHALQQQVTDQMFWARIDNAGARFWAKLEWTPWGKKVFDLCCQFAPVVLMSTPTRHPSSAAGKLEWINANMDHGWTRRFALTPCKHHMAHPGAILIDDYDQNCSMFEEHGGRAFLFPAPWNEKEYPTPTPILLAKLRLALLAANRGD